MYVLNKEKGISKVVFLENTDTDQSVCIGKLSNEIMNILGYDYKSDPDTYNDTAKRNWALEINEDTAKEISKLTLPNHKPNRNKTIKPQPVKTKPNGLDVLFGRADY